MVCVGDPCLLFDAGGFESALRDAFLDTRVLLFVGGADCLDLGARGFVLLLLDADLDLDRDRGRELADDVGFAGFNAITPLLLVVDAVCVFGFGADGSLTPFFWRVFALAVEDADMENLIKKRCLPFYILLTLTFFFSTS